MLEEDSSTQWKGWQVYYFGQRNVLRLGWKESREGNFWRGRGRSFHIEGPEMDSPQELPCFVQFCVDPYGWQFVFEL